MQGPPPLLVKIAPDVSEQDKKDIAVVVLALKVDGLVISNTTVQRPGLEGSPHAQQTGGLSGPPLFELSTKVLHDMYKLTGGKVGELGFLFCRGKPPLMEMTEPSCDPGCCCPFCGPFAPPVFSLLPTGRWTW